jgi:hypothetical protein
MAKYGRFDPRNKKNNRNKQHSIYKDIRIRDVEEKKLAKNITDWHAASLSWAAQEDEFEDDYND